MDWNDLPDGMFVLADQVPALVSNSHLVEWTEEGYRTRRPRPVHGQAEVITPPSTVAVLRHGYPVQIDEEAQPARQGWSAGRRVTFLPIGPTKPSAAEKMLDAATPVPYGG